MYITNTLATYPEIRISQGSVPVDIEGEVEL